jgi:type I restriction enzyme S subunit
MTQTDHQNVPKLRFPGFEGTWEKKTLDDIADILSGFAFKSSDFRKEGKHKIIRMSDLKSGSISASDHAMVDDDSVAGLERFKLHPGDFLFGMSGSLSNYAWVCENDGSLFLNQRVGCIREKEGHSGRFAQFLYLNPRTQKKIEESAVGAAQLNISTVFLKRMRFSVPTLPEQRKIAGFLGAVDTKIAQLAEKKRLIEDYKKGCMQQLFSLKIRFKDDDGNDFPDWEEKRLGEVVTVEMGQSPSSDSYNDDGDGLPLIQGNADIVNRRTAPRRFSSSPTKICQTGDILISVRAPIGEISKATLSACLGRGMGSIQPRSGVTEYWYQFLLHLEPMWHRIGQGSTFTAINGADIRKLSAQVPHPAEQRKIADFLSALDRKIDLVGQELEHARTFKQGLLQQMFV